MFKWRTMFNKIKWKLSLWMFTWISWNQLYKWPSSWFFFSNFSLIYFLWFIWFSFFIEIGQPNDQKILIDWYNSLESSSLNWNLTIDLCGQTGVVCDSSTPKRVTQLYSFLSFFLSFSFFLCSLSFFSILSFF